ncbi:hypothetical protein DFH08DRAFT_1024722 [Mycena albidolilacea]|uniref:F-box domain-containing protein n=1 Tax=Mycena albidolilacea TaxID=1033008 RepID=A0AAD7F246_9AGAR|nr:hypothetical protein DFH08DRAFT_1024722 [Mycena albidolilacea]
MGLGLSEAGAAAEPFCRSMSSIPPGVSRALPAIPTPPTEVVSLRTSNDAPRETETPVVQEYIANFLHHFYLWKITHIDSLPAASAEFIKEHDNETRFLQELCRGGGPIIVTAPGHRPIDRMPSAIAQLIRERDRLEEIIREHKGILAPIRRLPVELIVKILRIPSLAPHSNFFPLEGVRCERFEPLNQNLHSWGRISGKVLQGDVNIPSYFSAPLRVNLQILRLHRLEAYPSVRWYNPPGPDGVLVDFFCRGPELAGGLPRSTAAMFFHYYLVFLHPCYSMAADHKISSRSGRCCSFGNFALRVRPPRVWHPFPATPQRCSWRENQTSRAAQTPPRIFHFPRQVISAASVVELLIDRNLDSILKFLRRSGAQLTSLSIIAWEPSADLDPILGSCPALTHLCLDVAPNLQHADTIALLEGQRGTQPNAGCFQGLKYEDALQEMFAARRRVSTSQWPAGKYIQNYRSRDIKLKIQKGNKLEYVDYTTERNSTTINKISYTATIQVLQAGYVHPELQKQRNKSETSKGHDRDEINMIRPCGIRTVTSHSATAAATATATARTIATTSTGLRSFLVNAATTSRKSVDRIAEERRTPTQGSAFPVTKGSRDPETRSSRPRGRAPNRPFNGTAVEKTAVFWPRAGLPVRRWKFRERLTDGFRPSNPLRPFRRVINFLFGTLAWQ